ncbi:hypothetical protein V7249_04850, partial [Bacillus thuringiensis]
SVNHPRLIFDKSVSLFKFFSSKRLSLFNYMKNISNYNLKLVFIQLFLFKHFDLGFYLTK